MIASIQEDFDPDRETRGFMRCLGSDSIDVAFREAWVMHQMHVTKFTEVPHSAPNCPRIFICSVGSK
eukprot:6855211-Ditylum_brightwellii.AAC.1